MEVVIPGNTTADVYVPFGKGRTRLTLDGKSLSLQPSGGYLLVKNVEAGKHVFVLN